MRSNRDRDGTTRRDKWNGKTGHDLFKWIDKVDTTILKILGVSGGYGKPVGECDAGNLSVGQAHGASFILTMSHDFGIGAGGRCGKVEHPLFKCLCNELFKPGLQLPTAQAINMVYEAKSRFSELIAAVEQGDQVMITRRGVPVARLVA